MAPQPSRPSHSKASTASKPRAKRPAKTHAASPKIAAPAFPTCAECPSPSDCAFEERCADKARNGGRPALYSDTLANDLLAWIASGKSQMRWCADPAHPGMSTVQKWARERPGFRESLTHAREDWTHSILVEAQDIADDGQNDTYRDDDGNDRTDTDVIQRSKLRVETRMKLAAMVNPARYGPKLDVTSDGKALAAQSDDQLLARFAALSAAGAIEAPVAVGGI